MYICYLEFVSASRQSKQLSHERRPWWRLVLPHPNFPRSVHSSYINHLLDIIKQTGWLVTADEDTSDDRFSDMQLNLSTRVSIDKRLSIKRLIVLL